MDKSQNKSRNKGQKEDEGQENQAVFSIEKIYIKDASSEVPLSPGIFLEKMSPQVEVELDCVHKKVEASVFEVLVFVHVKAVAEDKVLFLIEVKQAGIFQLRNIPESYLDGILNVECPNIIFPYLRETVTDLSVRSGFPPVYISPVNFQVLFEQKKNRKTRSEN